MTECSKFQGMITDYLDENGTPEQLQFFENHFRHCPDCAHVFQNVKTLVAAMSSLSAKHVSNSFEERLFDKIESAPKWPRIKILRSLGIAAAAFLITVGGYWAFGRQSAFTNKKTLQVNLEKKSVPETSTDTVPTFNNNKDSHFRMIGQKTTRP